MNNETPSAFTTGRITWISHPGQDTARTRFTLAEIDAAGIERNEHGFECATELLPLTNTTRERGRPLLREFHGCTVAVEHCGAVVRSVVYA